MEAKTIIMNFTGIYKEEDFYKDMDGIFLDFEDLEGVNGYCQEEAKEEIRKRIEKFPPKGIHYLDSGNYHYLSKFWLEKIKEPFVLVVFDHHTDMQESAFFNILSCGSWIKDALETNSYLKKVYIIGPPDDAIKQTKEELKQWPYIHQVQFLKEEETVTITENLPLYMSIDKDVLCMEDARTNWDQGMMTLSHMKETMIHIIENRRLIGVDICGEKPQETAILPSTIDKSINNRTNKALHFANIYIKTI